MNRRPSRPPKHGCTSFHRDALKAGAPEFGKVFYRGLAFLCLLPLFALSAVAIHLLCTHLGGDTAVQLLLDLLGVALGH